MIKDYYAPYHQHCSKGSPRDGKNSVKEIVERHKELGFKSVLLTDHDALTGQRELFELCEKEGLQPRIGIEFYYIPDEYQFSKSDKAIRTFNSGLKYGDDHNFHLTCIVKNEVGYQNVLKMKYISALKPDDGIEIDGFNGTFYKKGRVTEKMIFAMSEGLIYSSGCRLSIFNEYIIAKMYDKAIQLLKMFEKNCETFMIELHPAHNEVEEYLFHWLKEYAFKNNIPTLIANDVHYVQKGDLQHWNALGGLRRGQNIVLNKDDMINNDDFYIVSYDEMYNRVLQLNKGNKEETIKCFNGHEVLHNIIDFKWINRKAPKIKIDDAENKLYSSLVKGLEDKFGDINKVPTEYKQRLRSEYDTAIITNNCSYYLEIADVIKFGKSRGHVIRIRGSAGSLLICHLLGISHIDPLEYGLIAERASNNQRLTEMDIDVDMSPDAITDIVDNYLKPKYGKNNIVNVANYGVVKLPLAIRNAMMWLNFDEHMKNKIGREIKNKFVEMRYQGDDAEEIAPNISAIEKSDMFIDIFKQNKVDNYKDILYYAKGLEGTINNVSVHAAANLILNKPIYEQFPTKRVGDVIVVEFDQHCLKSLNTLKLDLLRVSTISRIDKTLKLYNEYQKV